MGIDIHPGIYDGGDIPAPSDEDRFAALKAQSEGGGDAWVAIPRADVAFLVHKVEGLSDDARVAACVAACEKLDHPEGIPDLIAAAAGYIAMHEAAKKTNLPDAILVDAREKMHDALERIHG